VAVEEGCGGAGAGGVEEEDVAAGGYEEEAVVRGEVDG
jgi:hypothetical protein